MSVPESFVPDFKAAPDGMNLIRGPGFRFGYVDVAGTSEFVYGLFSGRGTDYPSARQPLASEVHVFTWDGVLRRVIHLDTEAVALAVTEDDRRLFVARLDPFPQLVAYDLPEGLQTATGGGG